VAAPACAWNEAVSLPLSNTLTDPLAVARMTLVPVQAVAVTGSPMSSVLSTVLPWTE
jgi:hypothetical protein